MNWGLVLLQVLLLLLLLLLLLPLLLLCAGSGFRQVRMIDVPQKC